MGTSPYPGRGPRRPGWPQRAPRGSGAVLGAAALALALCVQGAWAAQRPSRAHEAGLSAAVHGERTARAGRWPADGTGAVPAASTVPATVSETGGAWPAPAAWPAAPRAATLTAATSAPGGAVAGTAGALEAADGGEAPAAALLGRARAALSRGEVERATEDYLAALASVREEGVRAAVLGELALCALYTNHNDAAAAYLERALALAPEGDGRLRATLSATRGQLALAQGSTAEALAAYLEAAQTARASGAADIAARALANAARLQLGRGENAEAGELLRRGAAALADAGSAPEHLETALALADAERRRYLASGDAEALAAAARLLERALAASAAAGDALARSLVQGHQGRLYEAEGRPEEALALTRLAAFGAQEAGRGDWLFQWQWQSARLLRAGGQTERALEAYRAAVATLQPIRPALQRTYLASGGSFRDSIGQLYLELADVILSRGGGGASLEEDLREARATVELAKAAELEDYFRDDCVAAFLAATRGVDELEPRTAALYPIVLEDRVELLLSLPGSLVRERVPIARDSLVGQVRALRLGLEKRTSRKYLVQARALYDVLIRPVRGALERNGVHTLVFVPDDALRTIPVAALHDGRRFLVEDYAVATSPGLTLTDPRPLSLEGAKVLVAGLTRGAEGFPALPYAARETDGVAALFGARLLRDEAFSVEGLRAELERAPYRIVHIASHGRIEPDIRKSFLLASDGRVTLEKLDAIIGYGKYRERPLELLTLSACQTAAGDDRAALGLAGIAVKSGARSALASLWFINDAASAQLVTAFYGHLREGLSKAEALRRAQRALLADRRYRHPGYWAPFLLIGNWL